MGIVDLVAETIRETTGEDVVDILRLYENIYPADMAFELVPGAGSLMDFKLEGGDIGVAGFWYNSSLESIIALATQDIMVRLLINDSMSRFLSGYGVGPIDEIPRETIEAAAALAATNSPYIAEIRNITVIEGNADTIEIRIDAITPTGDSVGIDLPISGSGI